MDDANKGFNNLELVCRRRIIEVRQVVSEVLRIVFQILDRVREIAYARLPLKHRGRCIICLPREFRVAGRRSSQSQALWRACLKYQANGHGQMDRESR